MKKYLIILCSARSAAERSKVFSHECIEHDKELLFLPLAIGIPTGKSPKGDLLLLEIEYKALLKNDNLLKDNRLEKSTVLKSSL
ncbi:MAG TPA: hypothetical protein VF181_00360 [Balneolaceae bacterium]